MIKDLKICPAQIMDKNGGGDLRIQLSEGRGFLIINAALGDGSSGDFVWGRLRHILERERENTHIGSEQDIPDNHEVIALLSGDRKKLADLLEKNNMRLTILPRNI